MNKFRLCITMAAFLFATSALAAPTLTVDQLEDRLNPYSSIEELSGPKQIGIRFDDDTASGLTALTFDVEWGPLFTLQGWSAGPATVDMVTDVEALDSNRLRVAMYPSDSVTPLPNGYILTLEFLFDYSSLSGYWSSSSEFVSLIDVAGAKPNPQPDDPTAISVMVETEDGGYSVYVQGWDCKCGDPPPEEGQIEGVVPQEGAPPVEGGVTEEGEIEGAPPVEGGAVEEGEIEGMEPVEGGAVEEGEIEGAPPVEGGVTDEGEIEGIPPVEGDAVDEGEVTGQDGEPVTADGAIPEAAAGTSQNVTFGCSG